MPDFRKLVRLSTKRALALLIMASLLLLSLSGLAQATTTPAIQKAQTEAEALLKLIDQLDEELSAAAEDYDYAAQQLEDTQAAMKKTQEKLATSTADLASVQQRLNQRVVDIYKSGDLTTIDVLLDASSFSEMVGRYEELQRLSKQDAKLLKQVTDYKADVTKKKAELDAQQKQEKLDVQKTDDAKTKVQAQLEKQKKALKGKEAQVTALKKAEAARQAALVAAAKKAAAEAARQAAAAKKAAAEKKKNSGSGSSGSGSSGGSGGTAGYDADRSAQVVQIALQYTGVPYVWGGYSPSGFDCSGLVKWSYSKIGIYLPHSSRLQYNYGVPVARADLKPGDLVFFYSPIHHVGIYIGGGNMVNATGDHVQVGTVWKSSYYGARRILN